MGRGGLLCFSAGRVPGLTHPPEDGAPGWVKKQRRMELARHPAFFLFLFFFIGYKFFLASFHRFLSSAAEDAECSLHWGLGEFGRFHFCLLLVACSLCGDQQLIDDRTIWTAPEVPV